MFDKTLYLDDPDNTKRRPYCRPKLELLGDLRSVTLGGSIGIGESGGFTRKTATGMPLPGDIPFDDPGASY